MASHLLNTLPEELLPLIVEKIYLSSGSFPRSIFPVSRTCKSLRKASLPFLYEQVTILIRDDFLKRRSFELLQYMCDTHPELGKQVRHLHIRQPSRKGFHNRTGSDVSVATDSSLLTDAIKLMSGLKRVSLDSIGGLIISILRRLRNRSLHILLDTRAGEYIINSRFGKTLESMPSTWTWSFSTDQQQRWIQLAPQFHVENTKSIEWSHPGQSEGNQNLRDNSQLEVFNNLKAHNKVEELHLSEMWVYLNNASNLTYATELADLVPHFVDLRRLSVEASELTEAIMGVVANLGNLEDLRLYSAHRKAFHSTCQTENLPTEGLSYLTLPKLANLDIRYVCKHFEIQQILPRNLKGLRLEFFGKDERFTPAELDWLLETSPELERLELDVGSLNTLYSSPPTSDDAEAALQLETKHLLKKIILFRHIRVLRLFPTYWTSSGNFLTEPLTEQTAVRLFNSLQNSMPALQILFINITLGEYPIMHTAFSQSRIQPTKYTLRSLGPGKTVLMTRRGEQSYEMEQIWEGDRRLTTRNRPHTYWKPYFDDLSEGWNLTAYEMPRII